MAVEPTFVSTPLAASDAAPSGLEAPRLEYRRRLEARERTGARLARYDRALSVIRGLLAASAVGMGWFVLERHALAPAMLWLPALAFGIAVVVHERVSRGRSRTSRAIRLYTQALARCAGDWHGQIEDGSRFSDPLHPYAADLDLFGPHSLFQLLCTARTAEGEATLARWLKTPAAPAVICARQEAIAELRPRLDLRESLWIAGQDVRAALDGDRLAAWAEGPPHLRRLGAVRVALLAVAAVMAGTFTGWLTGHLGGRAPATTAILVLVFTQFLQREVSAIVEVVATPGAHLGLLAEMVRIFERELDQASPASPITSACLRRLRDQLRVDGQPASREIARLGALVRRLEWQRNLIFAPLGYFLLWRPQLGAAIEAWRRRNGPFIRGWIAAVADLEALCALATLAHDHPERPFPTIAAAGAPPVFSATALRHPLLPGCIPNDVRLGGGEARGADSAADAACAPDAPDLGGPHLMLLSGSNMSGKSTLMRTVGVNAVLALAGAPVHAEALRLTPFALGATLRIQDSLAAGTSRFYAEVTRLRQLVDLARGPLPLLFLIDEVLAGTNSHDRRLGASAVLRGLVGLGALGIASTHDLALTEVVSELPERAANFHFRDHLEDGHLSFDYRLRAGVVQHSNALALMRAVGLDV